MSGTATAATPSTRRRTPTGTALLVLAVGLSACGAPEDVYDPQPDPVLLPVDAEWPLDHAKVPDPAWAEMIDAAQQGCEGIDGPVLAAQLDTESGWNPAAVSPAGAQGLAQFMPATWTSYGRDGDGDGTRDPFAPADAIAAQGGFMCALRDVVAEGQEAGTVPTSPGATLEMTLAAYNAGPGALVEYGGIPPYPETQQYISTISRLRIEYALSTGGGTPPLEGYPPAPEECPPSGSPFERGLQDPTVSGLRCTLTVFPNLVITSGWRARGSTPGSDHPLGLAIDTASTSSWQSAQGRREMWQYAHWLQVNAQRLGIRYIIFHNYVWQPESGQNAWVPYDHSSGSANPSLDHQDHVHVSFLTSGGNRDAPLIAHAPRRGEHPRGIWITPEEALP